MSRDGSGTYNLPAGNPVISGTIIETNWANPTMSDIGAEMTDSLSRSGKGGMLSQFKAIDGTVGAPGVSFLNQLNMGFRREAADDLRASMAGSDVIKIAPQSLSVWDGSQFNEVLTTETTFSNLNVDGPNPDLVDNDEALITGTLDPTVNQHIGYGTDTIQSKSDTTTAATLKLNASGGPVIVGVSGTTLNAFTVRESGFPLLTTAPDEFQIHKSVNDFAAPLNINFTELNQVSTLGKIGFNGSADLEINSIAGSVELTSTGTIVARTLLAVSGGFQIDNDVTGIAGFERALTQSDLYNEPLIVNVNRVLTSADANKWLYRTSGGDLTFTVNTGIFINADRFTAVVFDNNDTAFSANMTIFAGAGVTIDKNVVLAPGETAVLKQITANNYRLIV